MVNQECGHHLTCHFAEHFVRTSALWLGPSGFAILIANGIIGSLQHWHAGEFDARSSAETPDTGPWRSTAQTDSNHTGAHESPASAGSSDDPAEDQESVSIVEDGYVEYGPEGYSGGAFQMTVSDEESERAADSLEASASLDPLERGTRVGQPDVVFHEAESSLASRSMRRLWIHRRRPFWLRRNRMEDDAVR
ncbi:hypothetical protein SMMN14_02588 [Sphaerulina musiva]